MNTLKAVSNRNIWQDLAPPRVRDLLGLPRIPPATTLEADVVVVGAGVAGLSAAAAAAELGAEVILVERANQAASGASGKNAGIVCMGANMLLHDLGPGYEWLWTETTKLALELYEAAGEGKALLSARMVGSLTMAMNEDDAEGFKDEVAMRTQLGLPCEIISIEQADQLTNGRLRLDSVKSVLWLQQEGRCSPWSLCAHLAEHARSAGARMYGGAHVVSRREDAAKASAQWQIEMDNGTRVTARGLIDCTGPVVAANKRIYAMAFKTDLPDSFPVFQDAAHFTYFDHRYSDGYLVCTGGPYAEAGDEQADASHLDAMAQQVRNWLPHLCGSEPEYMWAVDLKVTPNMVPSVREFGEHLIGCAVEGLGALGVLPGILLGRKAATKVVSHISGKDNGTEHIGR